MPNVPMNLPLRGIVPPLVTPLRGRDELDCAGLERLVARLLAGGVAGLFVLGTTGEGPALSYAIRRELIGRVCRQVDGKVPVLVGVTDTAFIESLHLARHAAQSGASALVAAPPYYLPEGQPELLEYLGHLVPELPLPLFLYNLPALTKVPIAIETVGRLMEQPRIIGLKDSSGDMIFFHRAAGLLRQRADWTLLIGPEELLADALFAGGHGGVNGGANLFPELYVQVCEAFSAGDFERTRRLQAQVLRVSDALYHVGRHPSAIIKGIKCALSCLGVCNDFMAEPFHRFRAEERSRIQRELERLKTELQTLGIRYDGSACL